MGDLSKAKARIKKDYGELAVESNLVTTWVPTGIAEFDRLMGGGLPKGRFIELYGSPSAGKSTLMLYLAKKVRAAGEHIVWLDYENAYTEAYAVAMGLPEGADIMVLHPDSMEQGWDMMMKTMSTTPGGLYVVDSLAAAKPKPSTPVGSQAKKSTLEGGPSPIGRFSATLSKCMQAINNPIHQHGAILVAINQLRTDFNQSLTVTETTPGGYVLKHYASHRVRVRRTKREAMDLKGIPVMVNVVEVLMKKTKLSLTEGEKMILWIIPGYGVVVPPTTGRE